MAPRRLKPASPARAICRSWAGVSNLVPMPPTTCPSKAIGRTSCILTKYRAVTAAMWPWWTAHKATLQDWRSDGSFARLQPSGRLGGIKLLYRHAWRNPAKRLPWIVKHDLDWNTLHDPDEIVGRIFGRKQSKLQSRATLEAVELTLGCRSITSTVAGARPPGVRDPASGRARCALGHVARDEPG